jgi:hypothetical protein
MSLHDLPENYYSTFVPKVLALDEDAVTDAARRHLDADRLLTVVVGDRDRVGASLEELGLGAPVDLGPPT